MKILIADDDRLYLTTLELHLKRMGFEIEKAEDGENAFLLFQKEPTDIVIADLQMPKLDGITLLKLIKNARPRTEVILLTGHGTIDICVEAMKNGAHNFLVKPIDYEKLKSLIENCIEAVRLSREAVSASTPEKAGDAAPRGPFDSTRMMKDFDLTKRETEIVEQIMAGKSDREIGKILFVSHHTVKKHVHNILQKTGTSGRMDLILRFKY